MKSIEKVIGIILVILSILIAGCISGYVNDDNNYVKTGKLGELIFHIKIDNDILRMNETTIEIKFIIENTKEERLYAGQNSGSYSIINLNNSRFNYSTRTPPLEDALLMFKPGNTTEYVIDIDTNFFFLYDPNLSYEDIIGKYRVEFEWGIFKAEPKYFVVIK